jgi:3-deoxy-D-manno-octulosonic-acid transferase
VVSWCLNLIYALLLIAAAPWIAWRAWFTGRYREGFRAKLFGQAPLRTGTGPCVWIHAVSVGEVNLVATIIRRLRDERPDAVIFLSTTTKTGYDLARKKYADCTIFYAPLDFTWAVSTALDRVRPSLLILAELEIWPNWIAAAHARDIPIAVINGRLSERSGRGYRRLRWLLAPSFARLSVVAVQNDEYAARFLALGAKPTAVHVTGSVKFDGARTDRANAQTRQLAELAGITPDDVVLLAGSTQEPEEAAVLDTYRSLMTEHPRLRLILVPRHPERFESVAKLLDQSDLVWQRRSQLTSPSARHDARILLVDTIGELGAWWGTAQIGFVGGSLGSRGGQNMIEPAAYGTAVCFGPNTQNFRDIVALLLGAQGAEVVRDPVELTAFVRRMLDDPAARESLGQNARQLVERQLGATERTWQLLRPWLPEGVKSLSVNAIGQTTHRAA